MVCRLAEVEAPRILSNRCGKGRSDYSTGDGDDKKKDRNPGLRARTGGRAAGKAGLPDLSRDERMADPTAGGPGVSGAAAQRPPLAGHWARAPHPHTRR